MDKELYVVVLSNSGIFKKNCKLNFIRKMTISKLTNIFMYNSDLQCMNANNNISINILVTSEANWKWGGVARPYQKSCQAKKKYGHVYV